MATYLADRVIVYSGKPAVEATACTPEPLVEGMNRFLKDLDITFRRDPTNHRPRINKLNSVKDKEQKSAGTYFYLDTEGENEDEQPGYTAQKATAKGSKRDKKANTKKK